MPLQVEVACFWPTLDMPLLCPFHHAEYESQASCLYAGLHIMCQARGRSKPSPTVGYALEIHFPRFVFLCPFVSSPAACYAQGVVARWRRPLGTILASFVPAGTPLCAHYNKGYQKQQFCATPGCSMSRLAFALWRPGVRSGCRSMRSSVDPNGAEQGRNIVGRETQAPEHDPALAPARNEDEA